VCQELNSSGTPRRPVSRRTAVVSGSHSLLHPLVFPVLLGVSNELAFSASWSRSDTTVENLAVLFPLFTPQIVITSGGPSVFDTDFSPGGSIKPDQGVTGDRTEAEVAV